MIKITADSTCDLSPEILNEFNITLTPLSIICGDDEFRDGIDIQPSDIFRMVDKEKKACRTAAVNVFNYQSVFEKYSQEYDDVIHICIGSGFSSCFQNAVIAASEFSNVRAIDSRNLSTGSGHLVHEAAIMAREGKSVENICYFLTKTIPLINTSFVIDRLDYLHKGGRCSGLELIGSKILNIKPCIEVANGSMRVGNKYRGSFEHYLDEYVKDRLTANNIDLKRLYITHSMCDSTTIKQVRKTVRQYIDFDEIIETRAGCTVSNHCGSNTLGIIFKHKI